MLRKYIATISYILMILFVNIGFSMMPMYRLFGAQTSLMDPVAGIIYLVRDFAQRELGHWIFIAMGVGTVLSYFLADHAVALASVSAFISGEIIDWGIFTFSKKPLSERLLWSSCISAPIDSLVFLYMLHYLNPVSFTLMTTGKVIGVLLIWLFWKIKQRMQNTSESAF